MNKFIRYIPICLYLSLSPQDMVGSTMMGWRILIDVAYTVLYTIYYNLSKVANNISRHLYGYNGDIQARSHV